MKNKSLVSVAFMLLAMFSLLLSGCEKDNENLHVLSLDPEEIIVEVGEEQDVKVLYDGNEVDAASVKWVSGSESVFTVKRGTVEGVSEGKANLIATYNGLDAVAEVEVILASDGGLWFVNYITLGVGENYTVSVKYDGRELDPALVTWTSNNTDIFTIENGVITGVAVGHGTFTATYNNQSVTGDVVVPEEASIVPSIEPIADGITIAVYIPEGSDCNGAPLWAGSSNDWSGEEMVAVEGAAGWYKVDIAAATAEGKALANFENWESGLGNWDTQWGNMEILPETTVADITTPDNIVANGTGIIYVWVKSWKKNPCVSDREYTFTLVMPACTPEGTETVYVCGSFPDADGNTWDKGTGFPIVDGKATVTLTGQDNMEFKARLSADNWDQGEMMIDAEYGCIINVPNRTFKASEGQEIQIEGWNGVEGCFEGYELCY